MVLSFSTNPFNNYYAANSKEFISLDKAAKQDFKPENRYDLLPGNADSFAADLEKYAKHYGYGFLLNVPSTRTPDAAAANTYIYSNPIHMLETWNQVTDANVAINANEIWGTRDWTQGTPIGGVLQIAEMTNARGEIGAANVVTLIGRKKFLERWKSTIMSHQIMEMLTPEAQVAIKLHKNKFQWVDPLPNETVDDGRSLLNEVLRLIRPDVQTNVYAELAKIKTIKPVDYAFNIIKWHSAMESKRISITNKVPGAYHESQYIMDYLDASLTVEVKSFKAEVNILRNRYLRGNPDRWTASYISGEIIKTYNNMFEDGTWKREIGEKDQIFALTTKLTEMQAKFEQQVAAFATQQQSGGNKEKTDNSKSDSGSRRGKKEPYTVAAWRLVKKEDTVTVNGKEYFWCTGDHYSGGEKHNGMYADHKSCDHDSWRKAIDDRRAKTNPSGKTANNTPADTKPTPAPEKKLTLNDKLRNAFCTQAGLSAEAVDRIWEDAQGNE